MQYGMSGQGNQLDSSKQMCILIHIIVPYQDEEDTISDLQNDTRMREALMIMKNPTHKCQALPSIEEMIQTRNLSSRQLAEIRQSVKRNWIKSLQVRLPGINIVITSALQPELKVSISHIGLDQSKQQMKGKRVKQLQSSIGEIEVSIFDQNKSEPIQFIQRHAVRDSLDMDMLSPPGNNLENKVSELLKQQTQYQFNSGLKMNQVFKQDTLKQTILKDLTKGVQHSRQESTPSFLGKFSHSKPSANYQNATPQSNLISRLTSPKLSQVSSLTSSSAKPPMPQSNMKRSAVLASKGDTEPTVQIECQPSLFSGVLSKVINMIGETQTKSKDIFEKFMGEALPQTVGCNPYSSSQDSSKANPVISSFQNAFKTNERMRNQQHAFNSSRTSYGFNYGADQNKKSSEASSKIKSLTRLETSGSQNSIGYKPQPQSQQVDISSLMCDPVHQFMLSDNLSMIDLKETLRNPYPIATNKSDIQKKATHGILHSITTNRSIPNDIRQQRQTDSILSQSSISQRPMVNHQLGSKSTSGKQFFRMYEKYGSRTGGFQFDFQNEYEHDKAGKHLVHVYMGFSEFEYALPQIDMLLRCFKKFKSSSQLIQSLFVEEGETKIGDNHALIPLHLIKRFFSNEQLISDENLHKLQQSLKMQTYDIGIQSKKLNLKSSLSQGQSLTFETPEVMTLHLVKSQTDSSFDVFGFKAHFPNNYQALQAFTFALKSQWSLMTLNPALSTLVTQIHKKPKEQKVKLTKAKSLTETQNTKISLDETRKLGFNELKQNASNISGPMIKIEQQKSMPQSAINASRKEADVKIKKTQERLMQMHVIYIGIV